EAHLFGLFAEDVQCGLVTQRAASKLRVEPVQRPVEKRPFRPAKVFDGAARISPTLQQEVSGHFEVARSHSRPFCQLFSPPACRPVSAYTDTNFCTDRSTALVWFLRN